MVGWSLELCTLCSTELELDEFDGFGFGFTMLCKEVETVSTRRHTPLHHFIPEPDVAFELDELDVG